jgi:hypothetical protein
MGRMMTRVKKATTQKISKPAGQAKETRGKKSDGNVHHSA